MKKIICLLIALAMVVSMSGCGALGGYLMYQFAQESEPYDSGESDFWNRFFEFETEDDTEVTPAVTPDIQDRTVRADIAYSDMIFDKFDSSALYDNITSAESVLAESYSEETSLRLLSLYDTISGEYDKFSDYLLELNVTYYQNPVDTQAQDDYTDAQVEGSELSDSICTFISDIINSDYCDDFINHTGCERLRLLSDYSSSSAFEAQLDKELELMAKYDSYYTETETVTAEVNGTTWTWASFAEAEDSLDYDEYYDIYLALSQADNAVMGQILIDLVAVRNEIAVTCGYDNYYNMVWEDTYFRDYSYEDFLTMCNYSKTYLVDQYTALDYSVPYSKAYNTTGLYDSFLGTSMSDTSKSAISYLKQYDLVRYAGSTAYDSCFSSKYFSYNEPMIFLQSDGTLSDILSIVHETGHATNYFNTSNSSIIDSFSNIDVAEMQSNGFSMIYIDQVASLFGDSYDEIYSATVSYELSSVLDQAMYSEIEHMLYTTEDLTLEKANMLAGEIAVEYGYNSFDGGFVFWSSIPHLASSPGYVASYTTSAVSALALWQESRSDYNTALEKYDALSNMSCSSYGFAQAVEELELTEIYDEAFYSQLSQTIYDTTGVSPY